MSDNWEELEDGLFATKTVLYDGYKLDVPDSDPVHLAVADYGGPVAVVPAVLNDDDVDGVLFYNGKGIQMDATGGHGAGRKKPWSKSEIGLQRQSSEGDISNEVVSVGWTSCQSLVVVLRCAEAILPRPGRHQPRKVCAG